MKGLLLTQGSMTMLFLLENHGGKKPCKAECGAIIATKPQAIYGGDGRGNCGFYSYCNWMCIVP